MSSPISFPVFLRLAGKLVTVAGGGNVALEKARGLAEAGARIRVIAPSVVAELEEIAAYVHRRAFEASDVDGSWLVVAAAPPEVNRAVRVAAEARNVFVVAVDDIENCSATLASRIHRGGITIAIGSDGRAPGLVALVRRALETLLPREIEMWREEAERLRADWKRRGIPMSARRPLLLHALNALYMHSEEAS